MSKSSNSEVKLEKVNFKEFLIGDRTTNPQLTLESKSYIKINIFLMTLIAILLLGSEFIQHQDNACPLALINQQNENVKVNADDLEHNCPTVVDDKESCQQKLEQCS